MHWCCRFFFVDVGVGGVIDGNGDGIWWQVLAVAFRRHWAVGGQVLAVDQGLPSPFEPRCDTLGLGLVAPGYEARAVCGVEQQAEMPPAAHDDLHSTRSSGQGLARTILLPRIVATSVGFGQLGCYNLCQLVSFIRSQPTTSQLSLAAATRFFAHTQTSLVD